MKDKHPVDEIFRRRLEDHSENPSPSVWERVEAAAGSGRKKKFNWRIAAVWLILPAVGGALLWKNTSPPGENEEVRQGEMAGQRAEPVQVEEPVRIPLKGIEDALKGGSKDAGKRLHALQAVPAAEIEFSVTGSESERQPETAVATRVKRKGKDEKTQYSPPAIKATIALDGSSHQRGAPGKVEAVPERATYVREDRLKDLLRSAMASVGNPLKEKMEFLPTVENADVLWKTISPFSKENNQNNDEDYENHEN